MNADGLPNNPNITEREIAALHGEAMSWAYSLAPEDAEDLVQQAYVLIIEGRARFRGQASLKTWLFGVIKNLARNARRRRMVRVGLLTRFWQAEEVETVSDPAPTEAVHQAISALPRKQREVIELHTYRGFSLEECAYIMRISLGSARTHYHRAKQSLANALRAHEHNQGPNHE